MTESENMWYQVTQEALREMGLRLGMKLEKPTCLGNDRVPRKFWHPFYLNFSIWLVAAIPLAIAAEHSWLRKWPAAKK